MYWRERRGEWGRNNGEIRVQISQSCKPPHSALAYAPSEKMERRMPPVVWSRLKRDNDMEHLLN